MAGYASNGKPSKKQLLRIVICASCHQAGDDVLGSTFASRTCARCQKSIEAGVVVQLPAPMRYKGMKPQVPATGSDGVKTGSG